MWEEWDKGNSLATSYLPIRVHTAKQGTLDYSVSASELAQWGFQLQTELKQLASGLIITLSQSHQSVFYKDYIWITSFLLLFS